MVRAINLLPHDQSTIDVRDVLFGGLGLVLGVLLIGLIIGTTYLRVMTRGVQQQVQQQRQARADLKEEINHASQLQQKLATIVDREESYKDLQAKSLAYSQILDAITAALPAQTKIATLSIKSEKEISLSGEAVNRTQVTTFIDQLQQGKAFSSVILSQANSTSNGTQYSLTLQLAKSEPTPTASPKPAN